MNYTQAYQKDIVIVRFTIFIFNIKVFVFHRL